MQAWLTVRNAPPGMNRSTLGASAADAERTLAITDVDRLLGGTADVEVRFAAGRMTAVVATFTRPPAFADALAACEKAYGAPTEKKLGTQFEGSQVRWRDAKGVAVALEETQGVLSARWERKP